MSVPGFEKSSFTHEGVGKDIYRRGVGPGVVVMHEVPGITPKVAAFARRVADDGFTVVMPHLFGTPNRSPSRLYGLSQLAWSCISREFYVLSTRRSSPVTVWIRALCRDLHADIGGPGVGALGMCLTGNFALALMVDDAVMAPVLSQPSLPFTTPGKRKRALHLSPDELAVVKRRAADGVKVLGLRFTNDFMCPGERFARLRAELGDGFEGIELDSRPGNPHGNSRFAHSVLTEHLVDEEGHPTRAALERVLAFFHERLDSVPRTENPRHNG